MELEEPLEIKHLDFVPSPEKEGVSEMEWSRTEWNGVEYRTRRRKTLLKKSELSAKFPAMIQT